MSNSQRKFERVRAQVSRYREVWGWFRCRLTMPTRGRAFFMRRSGARKAITMATQDAIPQESIGSANPTQARLESFAEGRDWALNSPERATVLRLFELRPNPQTDPEGFVSWLEVHGEEFGEAAGGIEGVIGYAKGMLSVFEELEMGFD